MASTRYEPTWRTVPNPFLVTDTSEIITGHISGRSADIIQIIASVPNALILAGAPRIGKSALIRYLQRLPDTEWSWRDELREIHEELELDDLNDIYFVQVDLKPLEGIENVNKLLSPFIEQCTNAIYRVYHKDGQPASTDLKGLRILLRTFNEKKPRARYFLVLDTIERLEQPGMGLFDLESGAQTAQERAIALLHHCGAIRTIIDLIDEFSNFGVLLSIESLPRSKMVDQFTHVSADLARFTTMTLQIFTWQDTTAFLAQKPENFGMAWAKQFKDLGGNAIFSKDEQIWLREQAGTHPYLLQQFCFHTFQFKKEYATLNGVWTVLQERDKSQLIELINERLSTFLARAWKRLQEAMDKSSVEIKRKFYPSIHILTQKDTNHEIDIAMWDQLGSELRYILYSEGIVRYDPFQTIHYPGSILRVYLAHKVQENSVRTTLNTTFPSIERGFRLILTRPENKQEFISLSELEYYLLKTLVQQPKLCTEKELMEAAWGKTIERAVFTQRMHQLRKKLKERLDGIDIIENRYGGIYSLTHPEWLSLSK